MECHPPRGIHATLLGQNTFSSYISVYTRITSHNQRKFVINPARIKADRYSNNTSMNRARTAEGLVQKHKSERVKDKGLHQDVECAAKNLSKGRRCLSFSRNTKIALTWAPHIMRQPPLKMQMDLRAYDFHGSVKSRV